MLIGLQLNHSPVVACGVGLDPRPSTSTQIVVIAQHSAGPGRRHVQLELHAPNVDSGDLNHRRHGRSDHV